MTSLFNYDPKGIFGPTMDLIYGINFYNLKGINAKIESIEENFKNLSKIPLEGKADFLTFAAKKIEANQEFSPLEIISQTFFKSMKREKPSPFHTDVLTFIIPRMRENFQNNTYVKSFKEEETALINEWTASLLECYMSDEDIAKHCQLSDHNNQAVLDKRMSIGKLIYGYSQKGNYTEKDLDVLLNAQTKALKIIQDSPHPLLNLEFLGRYFKLYSTSSDPKALAEDVIAKLSVQFRAKAFSTPSK